MNSGSCGISISSWMYDLGIYWGFILVSKGSKGSDIGDCLSSTVYGFS